MWISSFWEVFFGRFDKTVTSSLHWRSWCLLIHILASAQWEPIRDDPQKPWISSFAQVELGCLSSPWFVSSMASGWLCSSWLGAPNLGAMAPWSRLFREITSSQQTAENPQKQYRVQSKSGVTSIYIYINHISHYITIIVCYYNYLLIYPNISSLYHHYMMNWIMT